VRSMLGVRDYCLAFKIPSSRKDSMYIDGISKALWERRKVSGNRRSSLRCRAWFGT